METQVVVIGGGITGAGILRDLAMRGIDTVLVEKGDLVNGTSARFHGLLHSGARYAISDPASAGECIRENKILKTIAPHCLEDTGGIFVQLEGDDPDYAGQWFNACRQNDIKIAEIDCEQLLREEPNLSPGVCRAFRVPDGAVDGFRLVQENALSARKYGARVLVYTEVTGLATSGGKVNGVKIRRRDGQTATIKCQYVINAAGPWAGQVAALAGVELNLITNKGTLLVFNHRLTNSIINRCQPPGDGDIFVPHHTVSIYGTTSRNVSGPDCDRANVREVQKLLSIGSRMLPAMSEARILRAFAGVRPLYQSDFQDNGIQGRKVTRDFFVIDHCQRDGLDGLISIVGGKFTTYRLMAERTVALVAAKLGNSVSCRTAQEPLPGNSGLSKTEGQTQMICECEQVSENQVLEAVAGDREFTLNDLRRKTRLGMGTCQGTFCSYRALGLMQHTHGLTAEETKRLLADLLNERWKGMQPVLWGEALSEVELMRRVYSSILNLEGLAENYEEI